MNESLSAEKLPDGGAANPRKPVSILGVPLRYGADMVGVELGPAVMRMAGLESRIAQLGYEIRDRGDVGPGRLQQPANPQDKLKYLREISSTCQQLCTAVKSVLDDDQLPIILGGDHSIAIGSIAGVSSYCREHNESLGLIWFDAHADMNTLDTTPSG